LQLHGYVQNRQIQPTRGTRVYIQYIWAPRPKKRVNLEFFFECLEMFGGDIFAAVSTTSQKVFNLKY